MVHEPPREGAPRVAARLPHPVREIENCWIPMPDGVRLAARIWMPEGADGKPVPAIVEYIPYRKRDRTRWRDEPMHAWFAGHGYAAVRIDVRGSGDSEGLLDDEYTAVEHADGVAALRWIAAQPWCNGSLGMIGKSWGGFNALQIAALAPPELRAVISVCSTDDRYADDAHYMGGCLLTENLTWGAVLFSLAAQAPDPEITGPGWRAAWLERLEHLPLYAETWLRHPARGAYWKHGSVCQDWAAIRCPVYAVGGWADGYTNAVGRLVAGLHSPAKALVGPWAHQYPHNGEPGPRIGFLQEALRWWERWLGGVANGIDSEPPYRAWMPAPAGASATGGRWVCELAWPPPGNEPRRWFLSADGLCHGELAEEHDAALESVQWTVRSPMTVGLASGAWCGFGLPGDAPQDQRPDDEGSLCLDSAPLAAGFEILGAPVVDLELACDRPQGLLAVRLCEVAPDGSSRRVTYGLMNLTQRASAEHPEPLEPGRRVRVRVTLNDVAHAFAAGSRLRLALSDAYWPIAWPSPERTALTVFARDGALTLPVRPPRAEDARLRAFAPPETAPAPRETDLEPSVTRRTVERDPQTGVVTITRVYDADGAGGAALSRLEGIDLVQGHAIEERFTIAPDDPLSARIAIAHRTVQRRGDWQVSVDTRTEFRAERDAFLLHAEVRACEGERELVKRQWDVRVPRGMV